MDHDSGFLSHGKGLVARRCIQHHSRNHQLYDGSDEFIGPPDGHFSKNAN